MKKIILLAVGLGLVVSNVGNAADSNSGCGHFHIQVANMSGHVCVLSSQRILRGNLISSPPSTIIQNDSKAFDMEQTMYGPEIMLSYQCGNENITFTSKQNLCYFTYGRISGAVLEPMPMDHKVSYMAYAGSWFWDKPGNINWKIEQQ